MQIAAGLAAAHAQGLVHRDIKPGNILLDKGVERVTITDFGLARAADDASLTRSGVIAGTPQYMSPEQARGEPLDSRSDLFSLGSVLYAMCVGRPPFRAQTAFGVLHRIAETDPTAIRQVAPETPAWLCEIIAKLHAKQPKERFQSAGDVAELLGRWLAHLQQPTVIPAPPRTGNRRLRARRLKQLVISVAAAIAVVCLVAAVLQFWPPAKGKADSENANPQPDPAIAVAARNDAFFAQAGLDESTLQERCRMLRKRMSLLEQAWRQSPQALDDAQWQVKALGLQQRLDDLGQRIDSSLP
jgi:serine/threonine-protein kinase